MSHLRRSNKSFFSTHGLTAVAIQLRRFAPVVFSCHESSYPWQVKDFAMPTFGAPAFNLMR